jgi:hypothetical protein
VLEKQAIHTAGATIPIAPAKERFDNEKNHVSRFGDFHAQHNESMFHNW